MIKTKLHFSKKICLINRKLWDPTFKLLLDIRASSFLQVSVLKLYLFLKEIHEPFILILVLFYSKKHMHGVPLIGDFPDKSDKDLLFALQSTVVHDSM